VSQCRAQITSNCGASSLWPTYHNRRYAILFYSLLFTLAVGPLRSVLGFRANLLELFLAINLLAAVFPIGSRKTRMVLLSLLVVAFVGQGGTAWLDQTVLVPMSLALWTVIALLPAVSALRFTLGARVVDREHLYAGLPAYLLAGVFFGVFYWVLDRTWSGSFAVPGAGAQDNFALALAIYNSVVTLMTLGIPRKNLIGPKADTYGPKV
jgi:hypothetical protein